MLCNESRMYTRFGYLIVVAMLFSSNVAYAEMIASETFGCKKFSSALKLIELAKSNKASEFFRLRTQHEMTGECKAWTISTQVSKNRSRDDFSCVYLAGSSGECYWVLSRMIQK